MPPEGAPLTADQIEQLRQWIQQGAAAPADEQPEIDPRQHWAFQKLVRPKVPTCDGESVHNAIDAFIVERLISWSCAAVATPDAIIIPTASRFGWLGLV